MKFSMSEVLIWTSKYNFDKYTFRLHLNVDIMSILEILLALNCVQYQISLCIEMDSIPKQLFGFVWMQMLVEFN